MSFTNLYHYMEFHKCAHCRNYQPDDFVVEEAKHWSKIQRFIKKNLSKILHLWEQLDFWLLIGAVVVELDQNADCADE